jgi:hypothetical protein
VLKEHNVQVDDQHKCIKIRDDILKEVYDEDDYDDKSKKENHIWKAKVARYLAYCIDGGLMHCNVTI